MRLRQAGGAFDRRLRAFGVYCRLKHSGLPAANLEARCICGAFGDTWRVSYELSIRWFFNVFHGWGC